MSALVVYYVVRASVYRFRKPYLHYKPHWNKLRSCLLSRVQVFLDLSVSHWPDSVLFDSCNLSTRSIDVIHVLENHEARWSSCFLCLHLLCEWNHHFIYSAILSGNLIYRSLDVQCDRFLYQRVCFAQWSFLLLLPPLTRWQVLVSIEEEGELTSRLSETNTPAVVSASPTSLTVRNLWPPGALDIPLSPNKTSPLT